VAGVVLTLWRSLSWLSEQDRCCAGDYNRSGLLARSPLSLCCFTELFPARTGRIRIARPARRNRQGLRLRVGNCDTGTVRSHLLVRSERDERWWVQDLSGRIRIGRWSIKVPGTAKKDRRKLSIVALAQRGPVTISIGGQLQQAWFCTRLALDRSSFRSLEGTLNRARRLQGPCSLYSTQLVYVRSRP